MQLPKESIGCMAFIGNNGVLVDLYVTQIWWISMSFEGEGCLHSFYSSLDSRIHRKVAFRLPGKLAIEWENSFIRSLVF